MRLTRRGLTVAVLAVALYAAGELLGYPLMRVMGGAAGVAVVLAVVLVGRVPAVEVERTVAPERVERGDPALARLVVRNATTTRRPGFRALDRAGTAGSEVSVRGLAPGASAVHHYELGTERRGRLTVGPLTLIRRDPLGLAARTLGVGSTATLWVYPRRHLVHPAVGVRARHHHDGPIVGPPLSGSMDLRRLREYVVGDEMRHLHWKATARSGQLMVREYLDPPQPRFTVLLDTRSEVIGSEDFEDAIEVAASLMTAALDAGHRVRMCTTSGTEHETHSVREVLDRLCVLEPDRAGLADSDLHRLVVRRTVGGALAVVTGRPGASLVSTAGLAAAYSQVAVFAPGAAREDLGAAPRGTVLIAAADPATAVRTWNTQRPSR